MKWIKKELLLWGLCTLVSFAPLRAQTARWAVKPAYTALTRWDDKVFKVQVGNKVGLIDRTGAEVLPAAYDSLLDASEGCILALKSASGRYQVESILQRATYVKTDVQGTYFLTKYSRFHEGLLCVSNVQGLSGYMDVGGQVVIDCKYLATHPFCEGWASVQQKDKTVIYINAQGNILRGIEPGNGVLYFGSSFKGGRAVVYARSATGFKGYIMGRNGKIICPYNATLKEIRVDAEDYSLYENKENDEPKEPAWTYNGPTPYEEAGRWGYKNGDVVVLPAQFQWAEPFLDGYAQVRLRDKYGVLQLMSASFTGHAQSPAELRVTNNTSEAFHYVMQGPAKWNEGAYRLTFTNPDTGIEEQAHTENDGTFVLQPNVEQRQPKADYRLALYADDLKLWEGTQTLEFRYGPTLTIGAEFHREYRADEKDVCAGPYVTIKNNTSVDQTVHVYIAGGPLATVDTEVSVPGNSSKSVYSSAPCVLKAVTATVTIKVGDVFRQSKSVTFSPFY